MSLTLHIDALTVVLKQGDITSEDTDAIVNAANSSLMGGGGVDGAIHRAGGPDILEECKAIVARTGRCPTGEAVITTAGKLPARYVVHTVGPVWHGGSRGEPELLANAYRNSLTVASGHRLHSIAFPSISTGAYGYPIEPASRVALRTALAEAPRTSILEVRFVLFSEGDLAVYEHTARELMRESGAS